MRKKLCFLIIVLLYFYGLFCGIPKLISYQQIKNIKRQTVKIQVEGKKFSEWEGEYYSWQGTGFFVKDNLILTAGHMVEDANDITIIFADGKEYKADSWYQETEADLAVIDVNTPNREAELDFDNAKTGETVWVYGNPLGIFPVLTKGVISAIDMPDFYGKTKNMLITDAAVNGGNSGSPLFDKYGKVLGVCSWGYRYSQGMNFFVRAEICQAMLDKYKAIKYLEGLE